MWFGTFYFSTINRPVIDQEQVGLLDQKVENLRVYLANKLSLSELLILQNENAEKNFSKIKSSVRQAQCYKCDWRMSAWSHVITCDISVLESGSFVDKYDANGHDIS